MSQRPNTGRKLRFPSLKISQNKARLKKTVPQLSCIRSELRFGFVYFSQGTPQMLIAAQFISKINEWPIVAREPVLLLKQKRHLYNANKCRQIEDKNIQFQKVKFYMCLDRFLLLKVSRFSFLSKYIQFCRLRQKSFHYYHYFPKKNYKNTASLFYAYTNYSALNPSN